jgi:hypothetical protein
MRALRRGSRHLPQQVAQQACANIWQSLQQSTVTVVSDLLARLLRIGSNSGHASLLEIAPAPRV